MIERGAARRHRRRPPASEAQAPCPAAGCRRRSRGARPLSRQLAADAGARRRHRRARANASGRSRARAARSRGCAAEGGGRAHACWACSRSATRSRPARREAIARLHAQGVKTVMLSGDNRGSAEAAARALGIDEVRAEVLPADKAQTVSELRGTGQGDRDGRRRHQRRAGARRGRRRHRDGDRHRRGDAHGRHHADARRPAAGGRRDRHLAPHLRARSARTCSGRSSTTWSASRSPRSGS